MEDGASRLTGYVHPSYAESLSEFGRPRRLPHSGGFILERDIPGSDRRDAMGCYPRLVCEDWSGLCRDVAEIRAGLVSLVVTTDALADVNSSYLAECFDAVKPYKDHHVVDLRNRQVSRHHAKRVRLATRDGVSVERCARPADHLDTWVTLYDELVSRHGITGLQAFSRESFARQLSVPGLVMFRAVQGEQTVAAQLWYVDGRRAYSHLTATNAHGYKVRATYGLYDGALAWLAERCEIADLGAGAGATEQAGDGLSAFKAGWASHARPSYLCTAVFDRAKYTELSGTNLGSSYFPAYRSGEFA